MSARFDKALETHQSKEDWVSGRVWPAGKVVHGCSVKWNAKHIPSDTPSSRCAEEWTKREEWTNPKSCNGPWLHEDVALNRFFFLNQYSEVYQDVMSVDNDVISTPLFL